MRDPRGSICVADDHIVRELLDPLPMDDFLRQPIARELVRGGLLVEFELRDDQHVVSPRIAWVSQPSEWCRAQLLDAAVLTLNVADRALLAGFELKDASAWNVLFDGSVPVFCDHLSFARIIRREWRALGQFARHFILTLLVADRSGLPVHAQFRSYRDGITPQLARKLSGWRMLFSRAAPLLLAAKADNSRNSRPRRDPAGGTVHNLHGNLLRYCRSSLPSATGSAARRNPRKMSWSGYVHEREHYSASSLESKTQQVRAWIQQESPAWVLDLGANTGEFSMLAADNGARVIAVDADHECIERLYLTARAHPVYARAIHTAVAQLDDLCAGRGWCGREAPGILARLSGHCDVVMMLGLLHHLMIACAIPVAEIAAFAAGLARRALIIETIPERDPMFRSLAEQYDRADGATACGEAAQLAAFKRHFEVVDLRPLNESGRTLFLLRKRNG